MHPAQVGQWKREIQEQAETLFEKGGKGSDPFLEVQVHLIKVLA